MLKHLIDRPVAVTMAMLVIVVLGCVSLRLLPVSLIPDVDIPYITVQVDAPSLSAREMDESVIAPLRMQLIQVNGLKDIVSEARDGSGTIRLTFSHGDDISYLFIEVNEKIDRSMPSLRGIDRPKVFKASATDIPAFYINMTLADTTGHPDRFLQASRFAEEVIAKRLEQLPQVAMVDISGGVQPEIQIRPDADKLSAAGITLQQFESYIRSADVRLGSLTIRDGEYRYNVKFRSSLTSKEDIEQIYFKAGDRILKVSDVAQVSVCPAKRTGLVRSDGAEALCMAVIKQNDARMADLKKEVDALLQQFSTDYPEVRFEVTRDQTRLLEFSIHNLIQNIVLGVLLACFIIFLFMRDFRSPLLVSLSMPLALVFSMLAFYAAGLSLNIISLAGLLLGVGMMADNTIVLVDNITGRWQRGDSLRDAVLLGTKEVTGPMLSSILTTCAVFLPLVFVKGIAGALFYDQALAVTIVLFTSYLVTITVVPVYYYLMYKRQPSFRPHPFLERMRFMDALERADDRVMDGFLKHWKWSWGLILLSAAGAVLCFALMPRERLPQMRTEESILKVDWNEHLSVEQNKGRVMRLEQAVAGRCLQVTSLVGSQQFVLGHSGTPGPSEAAVYVKCRSSKDLKAVQETLSSFLLREYPAAFSGFEASGNIFDMVFASREAPLTVRLRPVSSPQVEVESLRRTFDRIHAALPEVALPPIPVKKDVLFIADPERLALYGVSFDDLTVVLKNALNENRLLEIVQGSRSLPVVMGTDRDDLSALLQETLVERRGDNGEPLFIPASHLMRQTWQEDLKTLVSGPEGSYYPLDLDLSPGQASRLMPALRQAVQEDGAFEAGFSGSIFSNREMVDGLLVILVVAVLLLYLILASQFESLLQPVIILTEIIVDIFFSLLVLWLLGVTINLMSMIGLVVVSGIVINDSILKIDTINRLRRLEGMPLREAILEAGRRRMKAILMTSLTTVLAVCPFLARGSMGADLQYPMSLVIVAGLTVGTLVSLFVVPALYYSLYRDR